MRVRVGVRYGEVVREARHCCVRGSRHTLQACRGNGRVRIELRRMGTREAESIAASG